MNPLFDEALSFVSDTVRRFYAGTGIEQVVERFSGYRQESVSRA